MIHQLLYISDVIIGCEEFLPEEKPAGAQSHGRPGGRGRNQEQCQRRERHSQPAELELPHGDVPLLPGGFRQNKGGRDGMEKLLALSRSSLLVFLLSLAFCRRLKEINDCEND